MCLNPSTDKDCFIRAIRGADQAYYSKLNPKQNWFQTMQDPNNLDTTYQQSISNLIFFEVNPQIPQGTTVDCRFRVRFTNCDDCYHDPSNSYNNFNDAAFNGPQPYKVIHLQFTVTD